ncbi:MAG: N-acetylglucosamine-6-phosphate deacetylase [Ilumatobacteraceae bacterium]
MTALVIRGGSVCLDSTTSNADVIVDGSRIAAVGQGGGGHTGPVVDASGCSVLPGFIDLQFNGALGVDLTSQPERVGEVAAYLVKCGVTSFMPTVISSPAPSMAHAITVMHEWSRQATTGSRSLGAHLEGPFLNPERAGAHPLRHLRPPSIAEASGWSSDTGVGMVTLAPELPGALLLIEKLVANGVAVCAGHTAANADELDAAVASGIRGVTHLFNAMGPISARVPGPAGATLADPGLIAGLIVDGLHVDTVMVRLAWRALGPSRIALVTDAIAALGLGHGQYSVGDKSIVVDGTGARIAGPVSGGTVLAGSVLPFDAAVRNLMSYTGCALLDASLSSSTTPARLAGRGDIGRLAPGYKADIVVLDASNQVVVTIVEGRVEFDPEQRFSR